MIDGYDVFRESELLCTVLRDEIIASKAKVVFRPDSGDMMEVIPRILRMQEMAFGTTLTDKGYKQIKHVGIIQGDGVNAASIETILAAMETAGYAADNIVFGMGGALLQQLNRDTQRFAMKCSAVKVDDVWRDVCKDPVTDAGKRSKQGRLTLLRNRQTGAEVATYRHNVSFGEIVPFAPAVAVIVKVSIAKVTAIVWFAVTLLKV